MQKNSKNYREEEVHHGLFRKNHTDLVNSSKITNLLKSTIKDMKQVLKLLMLN